MKRFTPRAAALAAALMLAAALCGAPALAQKLQYPQTRKVDHKDTYHGVEVADPYRWLEDDRSEETADWVSRQNKVTLAYLEAIPFRARLKERMTEIQNYPRTRLPTRRGDYYVFYKNTGLQNQSVLHIQKGLDGTPEVLLDPNKFSADGTTSISVFALSGDGRYIAYGVSEGGSDWQEFRVMEVQTRRQLPDSLRWIKISGIAWQGDGFYYSRYDAPEKGKELSSKNEGHKVYFHKVGTQQSEDVLVYEDAANPQRFHNVSTTDDERFAVLSVSDRGKGKKGNALFFRDARGGGGAKFSPLVPEVGDHLYTVVDNVGDKFLIQTNHGAPNWKVVLVDPRDPAEKSWKEVLPERPEPLESATTAGGKLFAAYLKDVTTRAYVHSLDGRLENELELPGLGSAGGFDGRGDDRSVFYTYTSFDYPPAVFRYDIAAKKSALFFAPRIPGFDPAKFETRQLFYKSKDGTRVPMFVVHRRGLRLDGTNPTLLYGYGAFNSVQSPGFVPMRIALLEQGVVIATANIRGGGEYGNKWHEGGAKIKKQNAIDDFIAAAEHLVAQKYTSPSKLAAQGGSSGGMLVGAAVNQRPELFAVALPAVGVMDMLRFHKFTIGWNWISEYGSSDNPEEFKALYAYSPLHNLRRGAKYPATLITTADRDDRVVPAHSYKYAAALQESQGGDRPVLIRVQTMSGHGGSSVSKVIEQTADIYAFLLYNLGVAPKF